jgi:hypothetical protein
MTRPGRRMQRPTPSASRLVSGGAMLTGHTLVTGGWSAESAAASFASDVDRPARPPSWARLRKSVLGPRSPIGVGNGDRLRSPSWSWDRKDRSRDRGPFLVESHSVGS